MVPYWVCVITKNKACAFGIMYVDPPKLKIYVPVMKTNLLNVQVLVLSILLPEKLSQFWLVNAEKKMLPHLSYG